MRAGRLTGRIEDAEDSPTHIRWSGPGLVAPVHAARASGGKVGGRPSSVRADCSLGAAE